ncbi:MAG TPA: TIGR03435 family protein [Bryobacteraceae bacterium]|nr:TIGR03435 family protein [Bryobacteraceae bacterium]
MPLRTVVTVLLLACAALAQNEPVRPSFEAASVKPVDPHGPGAGPLRGGPGTTSPGQLSGTATLKNLLMRAYELKNYQIAGPAWLDSERYEIAAKIPAGAGKREVALMLRTLLAERFRLVAHRETRELPLYAMVVAKNGPKFQESSAASRNAASAADDGVLPRASVPKLTRGPDGFPDIPSGADLPRSYEVVVGGSDGIMYKLCISYGPGARPCHSSRTV